MVGNGNHPLNETHYDENSLHDYVLGYLPPEETERIRQHLQSCPSCRAAAVDIRAFCQQIVRELKDELNSAQPGPQLNFDRIAAQWHPPIRQRFLFRLRQLAPSMPVILLCILLITVALQGLWTPEETRLAPQLADHYAGPPAMIAATTTNGLVVLSLSPDRTGILTHQNNIANPHRLQFSPDGKWLTFRQERTLFVQAVGQDTTFQFPVHDSAEWSWSPDGQTLAYTDGYGQLVIFNPEANASRVLVPTEDAAWGAPVWSEDGSHISYTVVKPLNASGAPYLRQGIWGVAVDSGYRVELMHNPVPYDTLLVANTAADIPRLAPPSLALPQEVLSEHVLRSQPLAWSPDGAWMASIVSGEESGLYLFSFTTGEQRAVKLPGDAAEKAVFWGDAGHLFVIRQLPDTPTSELWIVPLAAGEAPQLVLSDLQFPASADWRDVLTVQMLTP